MDYGIAHHSRLLVNLWKRWFKPGYRILMLKLNFHYFGHLVWTANSLGKPQMLGKTEGRRRRGHPSEDEMFGWHHSAMARTWANFGRWRVTGKLDVLRSRRVGHDWASTAPTSATAPRTSLFYLHWCAPPSLYWLLRNVSPSTHACCVLRAACCVLRAASCLTPGGPLDSGLPGSSVCGVFQARILEWVAIS